MNIKLNSNQLLHDLSYTLPAAVLIYSLDKDDSDSIEYMSESCKLIWEVSDEVINNNVNVLWDMVHSDDIENLFTSIRQSAACLDTWECEWRIITHKSKKTKWLRGYGNPKEVENGRITWNTVVLDITKEKEAKIIEQNALNDTIKVLICALEARDPYTAGHGKNVSILSEMIGAKLNLSSHAITGLSLGALVHDIGKIGTPSEILTKPTQLLNEEYALIKLHSEIGGKFFEDVNIGWPIKEMIEQHHERLDGSGYPKGLQSDDIILEARIIAVADVIDSMSSNRPYRFAPGLQKAIDTVVDGRGTLFDEKVVDAVIELYEKKELVMYSN